jgi:hypothetical protein
MARPELLGVSSAIRDSEVAPLTDAEQDRLIAEEAQRLQRELGKFVGGVEPYKGRPLVFDVKGPMTDPLQGVIHVHTVAGYFDLDRLPTDCEAYRTHVMAGDDVTRTATPETVQENKL